MEALIYNKIFRVDITENKLSEFIQEFDSF